MEQLVMVLVFALAAAVCLRLFVGAENIAQETARRDEAVIVAQNAAELLKAGYSEEEAAQSGGRYDVQIQGLSSEVPGLEKAEISVLLEGKELFSLTVGYREVGG
jgi:hypothetical protein